MDAFSSLVGLLDDTKRLEARKEVERLIGDPQSRQLPWGQNLKVLVEWATNYVLDENDSKASEQPSAFKMFQAPHLQDFWSRNPKWVTDYFVTAQRYPRLETIVRAMLQEHLVTEKNHFSTIKTLANPESSTEESQSPDEPDEEEERTNETPGEVVEKKNEEQAGQGAEEEAEERAERTEDKTEGETAGVPEPKDGRLDPETLALIEELQETLRQELRRREEAEEDEENTDGDSDEDSEQESSEEESEAGTEPSDAAKKDLIRDLQAALRQHILLQGFLDTYWQMFTEGTQVQDANHMLYMERLRAESITASERKQAPSTDLSPDISVPQMRAKLPSSPPSEAETEGDDEDTEDDDEDHWMVVASKQLGQREVRLRERERFINKYDEKMRDRTNLLMFKQMELMGIDESNKLEELRLKAKKMELGFKEKEIQARKKKIRETEVEIMEREEEIVWEEKELRERREELCEEEKEVREREKELYKGEKELREREKELREWRKDLREREKALREREAKVDL